MPARSGYTSDDVIHSNVSEINTSPANADVRSSSYTVITDNDSNRSSSSSAVKTADVRLHGSSVTPHMADVIISRSPVSQHDFLMNCNPVTISDLVMTRIKNMVSSLWPTITPQATETSPGFAKLYDAVRRTTLPNFARAKVYVPSGLVVQNWVSLLADYHDNELCHFLYFGWPLGYLSDVIPVSVSDNHPSALAYPDHIDDFISTEMQHGALEGPMFQPPFTPWMRISPLMTRPKKGTEIRRIIVDLTYPEGSAVNSGIDISDYLGRDITYSLPTVVDLVSRLQQEGRGAFIWKADLARAYRQLRADPLDAPLLGIKHSGKIYIDKCPPFGCRSSSAACQRVANAIVFILARAQHHCLAYLDDFAGCHHQRRCAESGFQAFIHLADYLGLQLSDKKCFAPATTVEWLGYKIDTAAMTIAIPENKLTEVIEECERWFSRKRVTRTMVQSLAGKLAHLAGCVRHGRKFLTRILAALRSDYHKKWLTINDDFIKDVRWFYFYAKSSNGVSLYSTNQPQVVIECDSSLQGAGGNSGTCCYTWNYTPQHKTRFPAIHQMEAVNILVAYRTLAHYDTSAPLNVLILTDNSSSSAALMTGRTKDPVLSACARELWLEAAKNDDLITIEHRPGTAIPLADALSRMAFDPTKKKYVQDVVSAKGLACIQPVIHNYVFFDDKL